MEALDILILLLLGVGAVLGFNRGLVAQAGQIAGLIGGILACRFFGHKALQVAGPIVGEPGAVTTAIVYAILFVAAYFIVWFVARLLRSAVHTVHLGILDRLGGAIFKAALWALALSIVLNVYLLIAGNDAVLRKPDKPWRELVIDFAPAVLGYMADLTAHNVNK